MTTVGRLGWNWYMTYGMRFIEELGRLEGYDQMPAWTLPCTFETLSFRHMARGWIYYTTQSLDNATPIWKLGDWERFQNNG